MVNFAGMCQMNALSKKVLLIKPDYQFFPIGFGYVVSALKRSNIEFDFIDGFLTTEIDMKSILARDDYIAVATGGLIGSYTFMKQLLESVKSADPDMPCILGGNITIDVSSKLLFSCIPADYLVVGEGELTFPELLLALDKKGDPSSVPGVRFLDETGKVVKTARRDRLDITSENWIPDWSFFDIKRYGYQVMPVMTGRGCTGRCTFCSPTNGSFLARPIPHILDEINSLNEYYDFVHFVFMNEIIFPDDETILEFCKEYKKIEPFKPWHCLMRMDVDPKVLPVMKDAGCTLMNVGVESGSDRVLQTVKKDLTTEETSNFIEEAKRADIPILASFLTAHYDERPEDVAQTIDLLLELKLAGPMAMTINYPGTRNYGMAKKRGLIDDEKKYIESLDAIYSKNYFQVISGHRSGELHYLNLSAMSDDELFLTVEREMRRYFTAGFKAENQIVTASKTEWRIDLAGDCPFCGGELKGVVMHETPHPFDLRVDCKRCGDKDIYFDPFSIRKYKEYIEPLLPMLKSSRRPALVGEFDEIRKFLMYDYFNFDFGAIVGVLSHERLRPGYALNYPIVQAEDLLDMDPDLLIVISDIPEKSKTALMNAPLGRDREIFYMSPIVRRQFLNATNAIEDAEGVNNLSALTE